MTAVQALEWMMVVFLGAVGVIFLLAVVREIFFNS